LSLGFYIMAGKGAIEASDSYRLRSEPEAKQYIIGALLLAAINGDEECAENVFQSLQAADFCEPH
jgi:hypothetical protein